MIPSLQSERSRKGIWDQFFRLGLFGGMHVRYPGEPSNNSGGGNKSMVIRYTFRRTTCSDIERWLDLAFEIYPLDLFACY